MKSVVVGWACMFMCIVTFITMGNIQYNANTAIAIENAANEASYEAMTTLAEDGRITTDQQLEAEFMQGAGVMLHNNISDSDKVTEHKANAKELVEEE